MYAGSRGVAVILASGDAAFARQFTELTGAPTVATKTAIGTEVAKLIHPSRVLEKLKSATNDAIENLDNTPVFATSDPVTIRMRFSSTTRADIVQAIPGIQRIDGYTVEIDAKNMNEAYPLIRLMYKYISWR